MHLVQFVEAAESSVPVIAAAGEVDLWIPAALRSLSWAFGWRSYASVVMSPAGRAFAIHASYASAVDQRHVDSTAVGLLALLHRKVCVDVSGASETALTFLLGVQSSQALGDWLGRQLRARTKEERIIGDLLSEATKVLDANGEIDSFDLRFGVVEALAALRAGGGIHDALALGEAGAITEDIHQHVSALTPVFSGDGLRGSHVRAPILSPVLMAQVPEVERSRLQQLAEASLRDLEQIRALLHEWGVLGRIAERVERQRTRLVELLAPRGSDFTNWLEQVDSVASALYELPSPTRRPIPKPNGSWRAQVEQGFDSLAVDLAPHDGPAPPPRVLWSRHEWMYDGDHNVIFVPDLERDAAAILDAQAALLGVDDPELLRGWLDRTLPLLLAHEYCHYWRAAAGTASSDVWFEEWAANRFAVALIAARHPDALSGLRDVFAGLDARPRQASASANEILRALKTHELEPTGGRVCYGMPLSDIAFVQLELVRWLLEQRPSLEEEVARCKRDGRQAGLLAGAPMWERLVVDICEEAITQTYADPDWRAALYVSVAQGKQTLLDTWIELAVEAELPWDKAGLRAAACYLYYCHINLTDDLQDGDCDYLSPRVAPLVMVALTNLSERLRARASVSADANHRAAESMTRAIAAQYLECTHGICDAASYLNVGEGIAGEQFASYFIWFLDGTRWEREARRYGLVLGTLAHLHIDVMTRDERFLALPEQDRWKVIVQTTSEAEKLAAEESAPACVRRRIGFLLPLLRSEIEQLSPRHSPSTQTMLDASRETTSHGRLS